MSLVVRLYASGLAVPTTVTLAPNTGALVGRRPHGDPWSTRALPGRAEGATQVTMPSGTVSENHLWLWYDGTSLHGVDLGSTNGTRWRLAPGCAVHASADTPAELDLGEVSAAPPDHPEAAQWEDEAGFREAVRSSVAEWMAQRGLAARVAVEREGTEGAGRALAPLGEGWFLAVEDARAARAARTEFPAFARALEVVRAYARSQRGELEVERDSGHDDLVLASATMRTLHRRICRAARHGLGGILQGESGVGKSALARCFHEHSERRGAPYLETNLAEDSDDRTLFLVKLFGARAGAASGITRDRVGLVRGAHRGTLFLDEVGSLPLEVQGVLLRFLDTGEYRRLGDAGDAPPERADVRVVAGTNVDLRAAVRKGTFREDLWWRLSGVVVEIPPLRERRDDVRAFLAGERIDLGDGPIAVPELLSIDARAVMEGHPWPGNFRELKGFVARLPLFTDGAPLTGAQCRAALDAGALVRSEPPPPPERSTAPTGHWDDLMPRALKLLPRLLAQRGRDPAVLDVQVLTEEVLLPLCLARALGVEGWATLPARPEPSYQRLAERIGYRDGKSVRQGLQRYLELRALEE